MDKKLCTFCYCFLEYTKNIVILNIVNSALDRAASTVRYQRSGGGASGGGTHCGLYLPSLQNGLSGRFQDAALESAYQRYSHRQRQKSFIVVNGVDVALKIIAVVLLSVNQEHPSDPDGCNNHTQPPCPNNTSGQDVAAYPAETVTWTSCMIAANILLCLLASCWKCFANNYLHWAAMATWLLMNLQGELVSSLFFPFLICLSGGHPFGRNVKALPYLE